MVNSYILLVAVLTLIPGLRGEKDYCSLCEIPGSHTVCTFPKAGPGKNCTAYSPSPLTPEEKEKILDLHNRLRSKVARGQGWVVNSTYDAQSKAADMRQLYWDDELELIAQRWVDQCLPFYTTTPHDDCRDSSRFPVGQNIVTSAYSQPVPSDVEARTLDWYNEIKDFDPQWVSRFFQNPNPDPSKQTGHYTQLVWGWTHLLGCARAIFEEEFEGSRWSVERIVCNYAPGGNFLNFPVYRVGEPCSRCPTGTQCSTKYTGLCARPSNKRTENDEGSNEADIVNAVNSIREKTTQLPPVTWQYWTPGKFWVIPQHLSQSPEEEATSSTTPSSQWTSSTPTQNNSQITPSSPAIMKESLPTNSTPLGNLTPTSSPLPTPLINLTPTSSPLPIPLGNLISTSSPLPTRDSILSLRMQTDNSSSPPQTPTLQPVFPPIISLKDFLQKFSSLPLFNNSKFTSVSWIEIPSRNFNDFLSPSASSNSFRNLSLSHELLPPYQVSQPDLSLQSPGEAPQPSIPVYQTSFLPSSSSDAVPESTE